jgi:hypothetical protein
VIDCFNKKYGIRQSVDYIKGEVVDSFDNLQAKPERDAVPGSIATTLIGCACSKWLFDDFVLVDPPLYENIYNWISKFKWVFTLIFIFGLLGGGVVWVKRKGIGITNTQITVVLSILALIIWTIFASPIGEVALGSNLSVFHHA